MNNSRLLLASQIVAVFSLTVKILVPSGLYVTTFTAGSLAMPIPIGEDVAINKSSIAEIYPQLGGG